ncbi:MAG: hypothetical protein AAGI72_09845 [Pseudomonadota bacterium]
MANDLFSKSIDAENVDRQIYSIRSMFWVAFFGGPVAIAIYTLVNSAELKRVARDSGPALLLCLLYVAIVMFAANGIAELEAASSERLNPSRILRWGMRILALAYLGIYYLQLRGIYRAYDHANAEYRNPWAPAIASLLTAVAVPVVLTGIIDV